MLGGLIIDKPEGWTSHDVVGRVRRLAGTRRVGHTGTLDPFATGVLVVCVGAATRLSQLLVGCDKEYFATVRLGWATDTQDRTGERVGPVAEPSSIPDDAAAIRRVLEEFSGEQDQLPPMYSAKKIDGTALYKLARAGREVERRPVRIRARLDLVEYRAGDGGRVARNDAGTVDVVVRVACSAGTYVRTLAHDVGERLGCGAHLAALRRTRVGRFTLDDAVALDRLEGCVAERLVPPEALVGDLPSLEATEEGAQRVLHGRAIELTGNAAGALDGEDCRILAPDGALLAIGRVDRTNAIAHPRIVLSGVGDRGSGVR